MMSQLKPDTTMLNQYALLILGRASRLYANPGMEKVAHNAQRTENG